MLKNNEGVERSGWHGPDQLATAVMNQMDAIFLRKDDEPKLVTGIEDLDKFTDRGRPWNVMYVAGESEVGKTALALQIAEHVSVHENGCVGYFSLREPASLLLERLICLSAELNFKNIRDGFRGKDDSSKIAEAAEMLSKSALHFNDAPYLDFQTLRKHALDLHSRHQVDLFIIDDLRGLQLGEQLAGRAAEEVIPYAIKCLSLELQVPFLVLATLPLQGRKFSSTSRTSDILHLESIQEHSDFTGLLWLSKERLRLGASKREQEWWGSAELTVTDSTDGHSSVISLLFNRTYLYFHQTSGVDPFLAEPEL